jgi:hypothetical protein
MCKFKLPWVMHIKITIVVVKLVSHRVEGFKMEQKTAIKLCAKLNKTATETFEALRNAHGEECLSRTSVFERHKKFKEARE